MRYLLILTMTGVLALPLSGAIREVPSDYPTIQDGIDAAVDGDTVLVAPGYYSGPGNMNIDFLGKAILVTSEEGPDSTIVDAWDFAFIFQNNETYSSILRGFTITGTEYAIYFDPGSPLVVDCHMIANGVVITSSCVLEMHDSSPIIAGCLVGHNWGHIWGTMMAINSDPIVVGTTFFYNLSFTGYEDIFVSGGVPRFTNCTFYYNHGIDGDVIMKNCIYWNGWGIDFAGNVTATYSDIEDGWPGEGNIDEDPLFVDPENDDFQLLPGSPCIDAGDPDSPNIRWGGFRRDMGAFEFDQGFYFDGQNLILKPFPIRDPSAAIPPLK